MRTRIAGSSPTLFVATHHSPNASATWPTSFQRADSPSERRLRILIQSSAKPSAAQPIATPNTARLCLSRGPSTR